MLCCARGVSVIAAGRAVVAYMRPFCCLWLLLLLLCRLLMDAEVAFGKFLSGALVCVCFLCRSSSATLYVVLGCLSLTHTSPRVLLRFTHLYFYELFLLLSPRFCWLTDS